MENKSKNIIAEQIGKAIGDEENRSLPFVEGQTKFPDSNQINAAYVEEVANYRNAPAAPCDKAMSMKLLRQFARKSFSKFWMASITEYLPAVSEGTMKLCEVVYPHDEAVCYAKTLVSTLSLKDLAKDFLYGVAHNKPEYRTALACYYYIKNLPEHKFQKKFVGQAIGKDGNWENRYNECGCEVCGYQHSVSAEPKMQFWYINVEMELFYFKAGMPFNLNLNTAIIFLEEYQKQPCPDRSATDYEHFKKLVEVIEKAPHNTTSGKLRKELRQSGLLSMTMEQIEALIDMFGYLNILHTKDSFGVTAGHICKKDMLPPLSDRGYAAYPVNRWTRKCGVDYESISRLFDGIYQ